MKTSDRFIHLLLMVAIVLAMTVHPAVARNIYICDRPAKSPSFVGNLGGDVERFIKSNFIYPEDAWRVQKWDEVEVSLLIKVNGEVEEFFIEGDKKKPHPLLIEEMERVIGKMEWEPGYDEGRKVNSYITFYFPLCRESTKYAYRIPIGMEERFEKAWRYSGEWHKDGKSIPDEAMEEEAMKAVEKNGMLFSDCPRILTGLARALCSKNRSAQALMFVDNFFDNYQTSGYDVMDIAGTDLQLTTSFTKDFSGLSEAWLGALRAIMHDYVGSAPSDSLYDEAVRLVEVRMCDEYLYPRMSMRNRGGLGRQIDDLKRYLVVRNDPTNVERVKELEKEILAGSKAKNTEQLYLFGAKAMLQWLRGGEEGMNEFIAGVREGKPSGKLKKYLARLEKNYEANREILADRRKVVEALACFAPPAFSTPDEREQFYARRRALDNVFSLKWFSGVR